MRYMLLICGDEPAVTNGAECAGWGEEMTRRGVLLEGDSLRPASCATTIRVRAGKVLIADGTFAETEVQIGGYSLIECDNLDDAIEVAGAHPAARSGLVEIRPVWET